MVFSVPRKLLLAAAKSSTLQAVIVWRVRYGPTGFKKGDVCRMWAALHSLSTGTVTRYFTFNNLIVYPLNFQMVNLVLVLSFLMFMVYTNSQSIIVVLDILTYMIYNRFAEIITVVSNLYVSPCEIAHQDGFQQIARSILMSFV